MSELPDIQNTAPDLKNVEAALRLAEEKFALLATNSRDGVCLIQGRNFTFVNRKFCETLDRTEKELLELRNAMDIADKDDRLEMEKALQELMDGTVSTKNCVFNVSRRDAGKIEIEATFATIKSDGAPMALCTLRDVTEVARLKDSLKQAEERFRYAARATQELIWECKLENKRVWCNEGIMTVFKRQPDQAPKVLEDLIESVHPDERESVAAGLKSLASGHTPFWLSEFRFLRGDGGYAHVVARAFVLFDSDRKPIRLIGSMLDNTQQKLLEARFMDSQRLSGIGAMANGLAHDVNNLLTPVLTAAQRLKEDAFIDESQTALLETIEENCLRGAKLMSEIMRYGDGKSAGVRTIQISALIESVVAVFRETFPRDIYLVHDASAELHEIRADELQIDQILMNLCIHARNQMPEGGELKITAENTRLDDHFALASKGIKPGPFVRISVRDEGLGYTTEDLKKLFDPTQETRDESYLGLATVKAIVEKLEGTIDVQSSPGKWTVFEVYLPAMVEKCDDEPELDPNEKLVDGHGELVMLVDDEPRICELSRETLERHGYQVLTAKDGADAISL